MIAFGFSAILFVTSLWFMYWLFNLSFPVEQPPKPLWWDSWIAEEAPPQFRVKHCKPVRYVVTFEEIPCDDDLAKGCNVRSSRQGRLYGFGWTEILFPTDQPLY